MDEQVITDQQVSAMEQEIFSQTLEALLPTIAPTVAGLLEKALAGSELSPEEGCTLAHADGPELGALVLTADRVRQRRSGDVVTYVVNRNINFTNVCFIGCRFCAFSTARRAPDAYFLSFDEIKKRTLEARERGATEVCVQGGLPRDMDGYHYRDILVAIKEAAPDMHIHAFSPMEVVHGVDKTGLTTRDYLQMLKDHGLGSLPGTAAEVLDNEVRYVLSRQKLKVEQWVEVIKTAHALGIPTTSTLMYGHVEEPRHWINQMVLLRDIQKETGGFTEFVPLGFVHQNTDLYRMGLSRSGPTISEHLRVHALGRLMLQGWIDNLQVSWVKLGEKLSQLCLKAGANDYSGTLMDENISRLAGATAGQYIPPEEFRRRIRAIDRIPAERSTTYKILRTFSN
jgi:7,8-didemethyl-8-hydroxy-5-deazariboflavin synthase CofH subunit